jgi:hypothetical protein
MLYEISDLDDHLDPRSGISDPGSRWSMLYEISDLDDHLDLRSGISAVAQRWSQISAVAQRRDVLFITSLLPQQRCGCSSTSSLADLWHREEIISVQQRWDLLLLAAREKRTSHPADLWMICAVYLISGSRSSHLCCWHRDEICCHISDLWQRSSSRDEMICCSSLISAEIRDEQQRKEQQQRWSLPEIRDVAATEMR